VNPASRTSGKRALLVGVAFILVAMIPLVWVFTHRKHDPHLTDMGIVPPFNLVDEAGHPITQEVFRGHPTIVSFLFTRCDTICPITTMKMENLQAKTAGTPVHLVSYSVDPKYDTPERLAAYGQRYKADPARWHFITGAFDQIYHLVEGPFMSSMQREPDKANGVPSIAHGGYFILVDGNLHIRGTYDSGDAQRLADIVRDARYLARTQK